MSSGGDLEPALPRREGWCPEERWGVTQKARAPPWKHEVGLLLLIEALPGPGLPDKVRMRRTPATYW